MRRLLTSPPVSRWAALRNRYLGRPRLNNRLTYRERESIRGSELALPHRFRGGFGITSQRIWLSDLPEGFRGFRILQLSVYSCRWITWQPWWSFRISSSLT